MIEEFHKQDQIPENDMSLRQLQTQPDKKETCLFGFPDPKDCVHLVKDGASCDLRLVPKNNCLIQ